MPLHDWTRVSAGIFYDLHIALIGHLRTQLNAGLLPPEYYALAEQVAGGIGPDVPTLRSPEGEPSEEPTGGLAVATAPPGTGA